LWRTSRTGASQAQQAALQQHLALLLALLLLLLVVLVCHQVETRWCCRFRRRATLCWPRL
jgi:hypothetical protein